MSWKIKLNSNNATYLFNEEEYETENINFISTKTWTEEGSYKDPDDIVIEDIYGAESEHGFFRWTVIGRCTGFNSYGEVEDIYEIIQPEGCELLDSPDFDIEIIEDKEF